MLNYGTLETVLFTYLANRIYSSPGKKTLTAFTVRLLSLPLPPYSEKRKTVALLQDKKRKTDASQFRHSKKQVSKTYANFFMGERAREILISNLRTDPMMDGIRRDRQERREFINAITNLMKNDHLMNSARKDELIQEAQSDIEAFVADVLIYAVGITTKQLSEYEKTIQIKKEETDDRVSENTEHIENHRTTTPHLPSPNPWFFGRKDDLRLIHKYLQEKGKVFVIYGPGGIGKTQIAKQYAWDYAAEFDRIFWINANVKPGQDIEKRILDQYEEYLIESRAQTPSEKKNVILHEFKQFIDTEEKTLLVYDGFNLQTNETAHLAAKLLPIGCENTRIIITSRAYRQLLDGKGSYIDTFFDKDKGAVDFLVKRTHDKNSEAARELLNNLDYYPLAMEIAAERICSNPSLNMGYFAAELRDKPELLEEESGIITDYPVTIYRMFKDTIDHIKVDRKNDVFSENIEGFLTLCAFLLLPDIEVTVFDQLPEIVDAGKKIGDLPKDISKTECLDLSQIIQLCQDKASIGKLIEIATDYGLIIQRSRKNFYLLKPLSLLIRHYADPESKYIATKTVCLVLETLAEESDGIEDKIGLASYLKDACRNRNRAISLSKNAPRHPLSPEQAICVAELAYHSLHCCCLEKYRTEDLSKYHQMLLDEVDQQSLMFPIYFYDSYEQFGFYGLSLFLHQLINAIMAETGYSEFLNALHIAQVGFEAILTAANNAGFDAFFEFYKGPDNAANVIWNEHYLIKRRRYFAQLFDPFPVISLAETALTAWMLYGDGDESEIIARDEQINRRKQGRHPVGIAACIKNMEPILIVYKEKEKVIDEVYNDFMDNIRAYQNKDISLIPRRLYDSAIKTFETEECNKSEEIRKQYTAVRQEKEKRAAQAREKNGN